MTLRMRVLTPVFAFIASIAIAQPPTLDVVGTAIGNFGSIKFNDPAKVGSIIKPDVTYDDVRGRYMWDDEWHPGYLLLNDGNKLALDKIKLNLYSQQVHYVAPNNVELAANNSLLKGVVLYKTDSTNVLATFWSIKAPNPKADGLYEQMNTGKIRLLKKAISHVKKLPYDPSVGKVEYRFVTETEYHLLKDKQVNPLAGLNKSSIGAVIKLDGADDDWLSAHKNKLKSETDVVSFLDYYNAR